MPSCSLDVLVNELDQRIREDAVKQLETAAREHWVKRSHF